MWIEAILLKRRIIDMEVESDDHPVHPVNIDRSLDNLFYHSLPVCLQYAGILIFIGLALFIWVIYAHAHYGKGTPAPFNPPKKFVASGAYRYSRNPMYVGAITLLIGEALLLKAPWMLLFTACMFLLFLLYVKYEEEPRLIQRYGASYQEYMKRVPRWISLKRIQ
jgi:protein-S-isoprenylcysteine O-methyltransferase Ste14